jgi:hypothetical protein
MALTLNRTAKATPVDAPNPDLPKGFDDPDSPWWTPPEIRPHYRRDPESEQRRMLRVGGTRWALTGVEVPGRRRMQDPSGQVVPVPDLRPLRPDQSDEDLRLALHIFACQDARHDFRNAQEREAHRRALVENVCRYCGRPGPDLRRAGTHVLPSRASIINGCRDCMHEAERIDREITVAESTVGAAVRAARGQEARLA